MTVLHGYFAGLLTGSLHNLGQILGESTYLAAGEIALHRYQYERVGHIRQGAEGGKF